MHTNHKLNFGHVIGFEIFQDNDTPTLEILVNGTLVFDETFSANVVHSRTANFYHEYLDRHKNCIEFKFTGNRESANRYVKIKSVAVNDTYFNILRYFYKPDINQQWFDRLSENKRSQLKRKIYGNNAAVFGWYGSWKYYFNSGVDWSSKYLGCVNTANNFSIGNQSWITLTKDTVVVPWEGDNNG